MIKPSLKVDEYRPHRLCLCVFFDILWIFDINSTRLDWDFFRIFDFFYGSGYVVPVLGMTQTLNSL